MSLNLTLSILQGMKLHQLMTLLYIVLHKRIISQVMLLTSQPSRHGAPRKYVEVGGTVLATYQFPGECSTILRGPDTISYERIE